ncbi:MAG: hypothetical protein QMB63_08055 [Clostridiaceae bacterium]
MDKELIKLAFDYRNTKLWSKLTDFDMIAIKMDDGTIGYTVVTSDMVEDSSFVLYLGDEGYNSYHKLYSTSAQNLTSPFDGFEILSSQNCIHFSFEPRMEIDDPDKALVEEYFKENKISGNSEKYYPTVLKLAQYKLPIPDLSDQEKHYLKQAFDLLIYLGNLKKATLVKLIPSINKKPSTFGSDFPLFVKNNDEFEKIEMLKHGIVLEEMLTPIADADIVKKLNKKLRKSKTAVFEADLVMLNTVVGNDLDEGVYPHALLTFYRNINKAIPPDFNTNFPEDLSKMVTGFFQNLIKRNISIGKIIVKNDRTHELLEDYCKKLGITLEFGETKLLDEFEFSLFKSEEEENEDYDLDKTEASINEIIEFLLTTPTEEILDIPDDILAFIDEYIESGFVSENVANELKDRVAKIRNLRKPLLIPFKKKN